MPSGIVLVRVDETPGEIRRLSALALGEAESFVAMVGPQSRTQQNPINLIYNPKNSLGIEAPYRAATIARLRAEGWDAS
ncbi:MAG: hypothetical protein AAF566_11650 [Pseudomonadota bacterium]